jgi:putative ABC transport system permease protein
MSVIGVIKKSGKDLFNPLNFDNAALIPYTTTKNFLNIANSRRGTSLAVKAQKGVNLAELKDDIRGVLRAHRRTKPKEDDSFSMNSLSVIAGALDNIFTILNSVGFIIGFFSLIVGMFGVANIMFVSVKERTSIIGIKKALGAKRIFILTEFLAEAVVLTFLGGCLGLLMVWLASFALTAVSGFEIFLSTQNLLLGLGFSTITGIIAGILPAWRAANLDPVEAIRQ